MEANFAEDLMIGAKPISKFTGIPVRKIFYLAETGRLPCFKLGKLWAARKSTLKDYIERLERGEVA
jgi:hypothetical protein